MDPLSSFVGSTPFIVIMLRIGAVNIIFISAMYVMELETITYLNRGYSLHEDMN